MTNRNLIFISIQLYVGKVNNKIMYMLFSSKAQILVQAQLLKLQLKTLNQSLNFFKSVNDRG